MKKDDKILIVGHDGIIEKSLYGYFVKNGYAHVISSSLVSLDPSIQPSVYELFQKERPDYVFLSSTRSGGIEANIKYPADFIYHNLESQNNVLYASRNFGVKKLLYYAGSCVYPKTCNQPMKEDALLTGPFEETSEAYSVAKLAGVKLCEYFNKQYGFKAVSMVPATLYGPNADMDLTTAHVMGALIGKFAQAVKGGLSEVEVWGSGNPRREFLYIDDFVEASLFLMKDYDKPQMINAGFGEDISIRDLAELIKKISGFKGRITFNASKPDGAMQKLLDSSQMRKLGWKPKVHLEEGIRKTYEWYVSMSF